jgi:hypothetical protein
LPLMGKSSAETDHPDSIRYLLQRPVFAIRMLIVHELQREPAIRIGSLVFPPSFPQAQPS